MGSSKIFVLLFVAAFSIMLVKRGCRCVQRPTVNSGVAEGS